MTASCANSRRCPTPIAAAEAAPAPEADQPGLPLPPPDERRELP